MIGKIQPNSCFDADKSTKNTPTAGNSNKNHQFNNDYQKNTITSVNLVPDISFITKIHNYAKSISKPARLPKKVKSTVNNTKIPKEEGNTTERPTRRPMNAFLIFCKRHRSVVSEKFPNLENREHSKLLGQWWWKLDAETKRPYTDLAKEYKDALFSAHPDFKWYKVQRTPPLRKLSLRSSSFDRAVTSTKEDYRDFLESCVRNLKCKQEFNDAELEEYEEQRPHNTFINEMNIKTGNDERTNLLNHNLKSIEHNVSLNDISILNMNNNERENSVTTSSSIATPVTLFKVDDIKQLVGLNSLMPTENENYTSDGNLSGNNVAAKQIEMCDSNETLINHGEPFGDHANKLHKNLKISEDQRCNEYILNEGIFPNSPYAQLPMLVRTSDETSQLSDSSNLDRDSHAMNNIHLATEKFNLVERIEALPLLNLDSFMERKRKINEKMKELRNKKSNSSKPQHLETILKEAQRRTIHCSNIIVGSRKRKAGKESITRLDVIENDNSDNNQSHNSQSEITSQLGLVSNNNKDNVDIINEPVVGNEPSTTVESNIFTLTTFTEEENNKTEMQIT